MPALSFVFIEIEQETLDQALHLYLQGEQLVKGCTFHVSWGPIIWSVQGNPASSWELFLGPNNNNNAHSW